MTDSTPIAFSALPALGTDLQGAPYYGVITRKDGTLAAVTLLADKPAKRLIRSEAETWAASVGGELPSLPAGALLYANAQGQFEADWHSTAEPHEDTYGWLQNFGSGIQSWGDINTEFCVRAVRLIPIA